MLHEPINEYQRLLTWYETDVDWARSFLSKEDSLTRSKLTKIQEYLDAGDLDTARKLYNEIANNNEIVKAVSTARSLSEDNPQIWGALHWLTADMRVFETVNYDLLSESVPRYSNNIISISELSRRKSSANCYVAVAGFVYDITTLLNFKTLHPALPELETRCGTNVSDYIASQPTQSGSANTARFKWILWWFEIGVLG
jgi:cytochrome b involved in lipid metabolism